VGSRVDFRKNPAETPLTHHDSINKSQEVQGIDDAGGASYFTCIFPACSPITATPWLPLGDTLFLGGGGCPYFPFLLLGQSRFYEYMFVLFCLEQKLNKPSNYMRG